MLEIKDKERSALEALGIAKGDPRLVTGNPIKYDPVPSHSLFPGTWIS